MTLVVSRAAVFGLLAASAITGCSPPRTEPVAASPERGPAEVRSPLSGRRHTDADVRFMRHMIAHHQQAVVMTDLVPERAASDAVRLIAERIRVSQGDEIRRMVSWLSARGEAVPDTGREHAHHAATSHRGMPGILRPAQIDSLRAARGAEFDQLFLEYMIRHHEGALVMVEELFATDGAGQELDIFRFASDVDADQRAEIRRMRALLASSSGIPPGA